jgi:transposase-like protein
MEQRKSRPDAFKKDAGRRSMARGSKTEEVKRLRRALREMQAENSLLKKTAALFAKDVK